MRRAIIALLLLFLALPSSASADAQDFKVSSFEADYFLNRDHDGVSTLRVEEEITAVFPEFDQNHGLLRAIPKTYDGHSLELNTTAVTDAAGAKLNYEEYTENDNLVLKIGDADIFVHGEQTYKIAYEMRGVALNFTDHDEFYWDVNGDQWRQPIDKVVATVHLSPEIANNLLDQKLCFAGSFGQTNQFCDIQTQAGGEGLALTISNNQQSTPIEPGQTLTFVLSFDGEAFAPYAPSSKLVSEWILTGIAIAVPPLLATIFMFYKWNKSGRDPKGRGTIIAEYLPPKNVSVMEAGTVLKEGFEAKFVSAQIISLAVNHVIKIYEIQGKKNDFELEFVRSKSLNHDEATVVKIFFKTTNPAVGSKVTLSSLNQKLSNQVASLGREVADELVKKGMFKITPHRAQMPFIIGGIALGVLGFVFVPYTVGLLIAGTILFVASWIMPARTAKGVELREYLLGLKLYMQLAEAERLKVLQSPHGELVTKIDTGDKKRLIKLYEQLLPYAVLFGIEKEWAAQFAELYKEQPDWYTGSSTFNSAVFATSMASFSSSAQSTFAAPSSSGSGSSGGSSGGGGGGGGGGGW